MAEVLKNKKYITYTLISILSLTLLLSVSFYIKLRCDDRVERLYSEQAGDRWKGDDNNYAEASLFFAESEGITYDTIEGYRNSINQKLFDDSYMEKGDDKVWIDAFSGDREIEIRKDSSTLRVRAFFVGGDFFDIHPIPLKGGSYFDENDIYSVVLDDYTAWSLFGSSDIEGLEVWIGDKLFTVAGVVEKEEDEIYKEAYGKYNAIYVPYAAFMTKQSAALSADGEEDSFDGGAGVSYETLGSDIDSSNLPPITCYTVVTIEPITDYTTGLLASAAGVEELLQATTAADKNMSGENFDSKELVSNTHRFDILNLYKSLGKDRFIMMKTNQLQYPYWENVARFEYHRQAKLLVLRTVITAVAAVVLILWIVISALVIRKSIPLKKKTRLTD